MKNVSVFKQILSLSKSIDSLEEKFCSDLSFLEELKKEFFFLTHDLSIVYPYEEQSSLENFPDQTPPRTLKKFNSASLIEHQPLNSKLSKVNSTENFLNHSLTPQGIYKNGRGNTEDRFTYVRQHQLMRQRNNGKELDLGKQRSWKISQNVSISEFMKFKQDSPMKNEQYNKLVQMNASNYKDIFLDKKSNRYGNAQQKPQNPVKKSLEESKNISFTIRNNEKTRSTCVDGLNGGTVDRYTDKRSRSVERKKPDSNFYNNKFKYTKLNPPKQTNPIEAISFSNKYDKALFLFSKSNFVDERAAFFLNLNHKRNKRLFPATMKFLIKSLIEHNKKRIQNLENRLQPYLNDPETANWIINPFAPSKTAQNGLNFISAFDERSLAASVQPPEILNIFKIMFFLMNEPLDNISEEGLVRHLITAVYERLKVDNIKSLFINYIIKISYFTEDQLGKISSITDKYPKVFFSSELLKINKTVSFFSFFLKEFYEFSMAKAPDGVYYFKLRKTHRKIKQLTNKVSFLEKKLTY